MPESMGYGGKTSELINKITSAKTYPCVIEQIVEPSISENTFRVLGTLLDRCLVCDVKLENVKLLRKLCMQILKDRGLIWFASCRNDNIGRSTQ